jgi:hypothetical protein
MIDVQQLHPKPTALGLQDPHAPGVVLEPFAGDGPLAPPLVAGAEDTADQARSAHRRRRWFSACSGFQDTIQDVDFDTMTLPAQQGPIVRAKAGKARRGWYAPAATPAPTTTRQAEILNTALIAAPTDDEGVVVGRDRLSNAPVAHDPFTAYEKKTITSPNVVVLGVVGAGKSSLLKTVYVLRPIILRGRRVVIIDKKDRAGEGENAELTRELGTEPFRMVLGGGGTVLNLLDPAILAGDGIAGQYRLLLAVAEEANDGRLLDKWERHALRVAHKATLAATEADGVDPLLEHLVFHLGTGHADFQDFSAAAQERLHQAGLGVRFLFEASLSDELAGLFDGPTSKHVQLASRLTTFDVSQLPEAGPAVSMVMAVANVWLLGTLRNQRNYQTNFIAEEGWSLSQGGTGRLMRSNSKLARGLGLSNIASFHHPADIPRDSPAVAMLKEAQTIHLYRQDRAEDIDMCMTSFALEAGSREVLANLENGHHLMKIGNRREIHVEHVRSDFEARITNTDEAMIAGPR